MQLLHVCVRACLDPLVSTARRAARQECISKPAALSPLRRSQLTCQNGAQHDQEVPKLLPKLLAAFTQSRGMITALSDCGLLCAMPMSFTSPAFEDVACFTAGKKSQLRCAHSAHHSHIEVNTEQV